MNEILFRDFKAYAPVEILRRIGLFVQSRKQTELPQITVYLDSGVSLSGAFLAQSDDGHSLLLKDDAAGKVNAQTLYLDIAAIQCVRVHEVQPLAATLRGATIRRSSAGKAPSRLQLMRHIESCMQQLSTAVGFPMTCTVDWADPPTDNELLNVQDVFNTVLSAMQAAVRDDLGKEAMRGFPSLSLRQAAKPLQMSAQPQALVICFDFSIPLPENYAKVLSDELNALL